MNPWLYATGLIATLSVATMTWVISLWKRDVSIVDGVWGVMFVAAASVYAYGADRHTGRTALVLTLIVLWAMRLSSHIIVRNWGEPEDRRYRDIRQRHQPHFALKSLGLVFWFQAALAWIISMPLWPALTAPVESGVFELLALAVWTVGMGFESIADWQLLRFKANPANEGKVMDRGLWRYTRHPNYFGECLVWWGLYLFAVPTGAWWTIAGPLLLTFLLLRVSGVALLEQTIAERRPAYRAYRARTNAFIPGPPRVGVDRSASSNRGAA